MTVSLLAQLRTAPTLSGIKYRISRGITRVWHRLGTFLFADGPRTRFASTLYFRLFDRTFDGEQWQSAAGNRHFRSELGNRFGSSPLLRRNVHRIEKGLSMRESRPSFGADYIDITVAQFAKRLLAPDRDDAELAWAKSVLDRFFLHGENEQRFRDAADAYRRLDFEPAILDRHTSPFRRNATQSPACDYDALMALARHRRSVRFFVDRPVERSLLEKAAAMALEAPSACNRQPFEIRIFDDQRRAAQIAALAMGTAGYANNIPVLAVFLGQTRHFAHGRDRHLPYVDGSLAAMSFALALESLGLSSCMINWPDVPERDERMANVLELAADERPIMLMAVGYADYSVPVPASVKKPVDRVLVYDHP